MNRLAIALVVIFIVTERQHSALGKPHLKLIDTSSIRIFDTQLLAGRLKQNQKPIFPVASLWQVADNPKGYILDYSFGGVSKKIPITETEFQELQRVQRQYLNPDIAYEIRSEAGTYRKARASELIIHVNGRELDKYSAADNELLVNEARGKSRIKVGVNYAVLEPERVDSGEFEGRLLVDSMGRARYKVQYQPVPIYENSPADGEPYLAGQYRRLSINKEGSSSHHVVNFGPNIDGGEQSLPIPLFVLSFVEKNGERFAVAVPSDVGLQHRVAYPEEAYLIPEDLLHRVIDEGRWMDINYSYLSYLGESALDVYKAGENGPASASLKLNTILSPSEIKQIFPHWVPTEEPIRSHSGFAKIVGVLKPLLLVCILSAKRFFQGGSGE